MTKLQGYWSLLWLASLLAAAVSFYATGAGLARSIDNVLAWSLALAVQVGLFAMAWLIGMSPSNLRGIIVLLYCVGMPFSVVYSFITLQGELLREVRATSSSGDLLDRTSSGYTQMSDLVQRAISQAAEADVRLQGLLTMEEQVGGAIQACGSEQNCLVQDTCEKVRLKMEGWQETLGIRFMNQRGKHRVYWAIQGERQALEAVRDQVTEFQSEMSPDDLRNPELDDRARVTAFNSLRQRFPLADVERLLCGSVELPELLGTDDYRVTEDELAREAHDAIQDLWRLLRLGGAQEEEDYLTLMACFLAVFIDLFILMVALGAAKMSETPGRGSGGLGPDGAEAEALIDDWIDGALLSLARDSTERERFLEQLAHDMEQDRGNRILLTPGDPEQYRFAELAALSGHASQEKLDGGRSGSEEVAFVLADWVFPAVAARFGGAKSHREEREASTR